MVLQMTKKFSHSLLVDLLAPACAAAGITAARADIYVIESRVAAVAVGAILQER